jgi:L-serine/L-threonine ammonia-lyase
MSPLYIETPVIESHLVGKRFGKRLFLKMENLQPSGSFKMRGISTMCQHMVKAGQKHIISSSGGNAGYTAAFAAQLMGIPATIFVPESTREHVVRMMRDLGADVQKHGRFWEEAHTAALAFASSHQAEVIHPFNNSIIWEGHASMVDEIVRQTIKPDVIVLSVGGGGLLAGVAMGLRRYGWEDVPIITVETHGADSLAQAIQAGKPVRLPEITSSVKTLGANQVCDEAFRVTQELRVLPVVVSDEEATRPCLQFMDDHRMLVEPACGAALSVVYNRHPALDEFKTVLVIVCGGISFSVKDLK